MDSCVSTNAVCIPHVADDDMTAHAPSDIYPYIYPSPVTSGDMAYCILTNTVSSTHVAEDHMIAQVPSYIYPFLVTSGHMESNIFTNTVCST